MIGGENMSKRILSTALVLLMCLSFSIPAFAAGETVSASYSAGAVSVSGMGYTSETDYIVRIVDTANSSVTAITQTTADGTGSISVSVTTGALGTLSDYAVYVNDLSGNSVATAAITGSAAAYYTVTFNANGGSVSPASARTGADGKLTALPAPTRTNYRFDGWFTAASGGTQVTLGTVFSSDGTIYARWTYTGSSGGGSHTGGGGSATPTAPTTPAEPSASTFASDTTLDFSVKEAYTFKITSKNGAAPSLVVGTAGVFETQLVSTSGSDYFFRLTAVGRPGDKAGIYVNGVKLLVATVGTAASPVKSDTTAPFQVAGGKSYTFRLTADTKPSFVSGNSSVFQAKLVKESGKDYFYQVTAVGKPGQAAGFYVDSETKPVAVATIA